MDKTNLEDLRNWREKTTHRTELQVAVESILFIAIEILAIGGNTMVLTAVWRSKSLRTITHQYITVLSIADLCVALFDFPFCVASSITGKWPHGELFCRIQGMSLLVWCTFTMILVSVTAVNRYVCVVKSNLYKKFFTSKTTALTIVSTLVLCTALIIGVSTGLSAKYQFGPHLFCIPIFPTKQTQMAILLPTFFLFILLPMVTMFICYFKVFRRVRQHVNEVAPSLSRGATQNLKARVEEAKITKVVFAVLMAFFVLWAPVCIIGILFVIGTFLPRWAHLMYDYLVMASAATNPLVYGFLNQTFRAEYTKILGCINVQGQRRQMSVVEFSAGGESRGQQLTMLRIRRPNPRTNAMNQTT